VHRADQLLALAAIADGATCCADPAGERVVGDHATIPNGLQQFVPGHYAVVVSDEVDENIENLRFKVDSRAAAPQLAALAVELAVGKHISHRCASKVSDYPAG
jgi:hypothetical protein